MKRVIVSFLAVLSLAACTQPLSGGAYMKTPSAQADTVVANVGEPVQFVVRGGFGAQADYYRDEFTQPGVTFGACIYYASDVATQGGLCPNGEQPLPAGLSLVDSSHFAKDFGDVTVKRGESRDIEHTFTLTAERPLTVRVVAAYFFDYGTERDSGYEAGDSVIAQVTFE